MSSRWHNNQLTPNISLASGNPWASGGWVPKLRRKVERGESWQWNFQPPVVVWIEFIFPSLPFIFPQYMPNMLRDIASFWWTKKYLPHHFTSKDVRYGFDSPVPLWQRGWFYRVNHREIHGGLPTWYQSCFVIYGDVFHLGMVRFQNFMIKKKRDIIGHPKCNYQDLRWWIF